MRLLAMRKGGWIGTVRALATGGIALGGIFGGLSVSEVAVPLVVLVIGFAADDLWAARKEINENETPSG